MFSGISEQVRTRDSYGFVEGLTASVNLNSSYLEKIKRLQRTKGFTSLSALITWMETPRLSPGQQHGWCPSRVTMIQYQQGAERKTTTMDTVDNLQKALNDTDSTGLCKVHPHTDQSIKLLLVEDISGEVVQVLGLRYKVDPRFFRDHICERRDRDNTGLLASSSHRQWFQLRSTRRYPVNTRGPTPTSFCRNVGRSCNQLPVEVVSIRGTATIETSTSIWIGQDPTCPNQTIGIVLLDFTDPKTKATPGTRDACVAMTDLDTLSTGSAPSMPQTWYDDLVDMTERYPWFETTRCLESVDKLSIVCPSLYSICAEWLELLDVAKSKMTQFEQDLKRELYWNPIEYTISNVLRQLAGWHEHIQSWREQVEETLESGLVAATRLTQPQPPHPLAEIATDFERVRDKLVAIERRIDRLFDRGTAEMQLLAASQSLAESHDLARLTWLATIFVPLTYVTGLFSMSEDLGSMKSTFKMYFAVAIPVALVALVIARWGSKLSPYVKEVRRWASAILCFAMICWSSR